MKGLAKILLILCSGVVINFAVAWTCALSADLSWQAADSTFEGGWSETSPINSLAQSNYYPGFARVSLQYLDDRVPMSYRISSGESHGGFSAAIPRWSGLSEPPSQFDGSQIASIRQEIELCGWPLLCLTSTTAHSIATVSSSAAFPTWTRAENLGFRIPWIASRCPPRQSSRCLPVRPICSPFLINSVLFSLPAALTVVTSSFKARRRKSLGLCVRCAYPIGTAELATCPECGRAA